MVITLGLAWLLAGCVGYHSTARRMQPARDFEIVETSAKRHLSDQDMAYLRAKVIDYLSRQGESGSGDYYLKVYLGEETDLEQREWVVVRYTRYPSAISSVAYNTPTYRYPAYGYSSLDYYPFGFLGFGTFSYRYYDDPYYYGNGALYPNYYNPGWGRGERDRWHNRRPGHNHPRDGDKDAPPQVGGTRPSGALKPSFVPGNLGGGRWTEGGAAHADSRRGQNRGDRPGHDSRPAYSPPSLPQATAEVAPSYRPSTRSNFHRERPESGYTRRSNSENASAPSTPVRAERSYERPSRSESSESRQQTAPSYSSPAPSYPSSSVNERSEGSSWSHGDRGGRDGRRNGADP